MGEAFMSSYERFLVVFPRRAESLSPKIKMITIVRKTKCPILIKCRTAVCGQYGRHCGRNK